MTMRCTRESAPQQQSRNSETTTTTMTSQATMTSLKLIRMSRLSLPLLLVMMMTSMTVMMPLVAGIELQAADEAEATNTLEQRGGDKNNASDAYPRQYPSGIPGGGMALPGYGGYGGIGGGVPGFAGNPGAGSFNGAGNFGGVGGGYPGGFAPGIGGGGGGGVGIGGAAAPGCPLCDASVYSYCSHKMVHDACCCDFPAQQQKPPQCLYYDCSLLYAKSCYEHSLIKNCCCNNPY